MFSSPIQWKQIKAIFGVLCNNSNKTKQKFGKIKEIYYGHVLLLNAIIVNNSNRFQNIGFESEITGFNPFNTETLLLALGY